MATYSLKELKSIGAQAITDFLNGILQSYPPLLKITMFKNSNIKQSNVKQSNVKQSHVKQLNNHKT